MKALVTGAAGFIGSHLSAALLDAGATVTGLDCFTDYYPRPLKEANLATVREKPGFRFVEAALQDTDLKALVSGVTHVFHLAAQAGVRKSWGRDFNVYTKNNVEATQRLLEALVGVPIQKYVYASSSSVYGDDVPLPMQEDAYYSRYRRTASRSLRPNTSGTSIGRTSAFPLSRCDISRSMDLASGRIWGSSAF